MGVADKISELAEQWAAGSDEKRSATEDAIEGALKEFDEWCRSQVSIPLIDPEKSLAENYDLLWARYVASTADRG